MYDYRAAWRGDLALRWRSRDGSRYLSTMALVGREVASSQSGDMEGRKQWGRATSHRMSALEMHGNGFKGLAL